MTIPVERVSFGAQLPVTLELGAHGEIRCVLDPDSIRELEVDLVFIDPGGGKEPITITENTTTIPPTDVQRAIEAAADALMTAMEVRAPFEMCVLVT